MSEKLEVKLGFSVQAFPDNAARREVEALAAVCPNEGCTWTGTIKEFEVHVNAKQAQCPFI